ncbi:MAG: DUF3106 domain-containing protein [Comamonas sp.]
MRHEQAFEEDAASAPTSSFIPTIAASILLAAFAVTGIYASHKASNVYGSAPSDLVSITGTTRTASPRNEGLTWEQLEEDQQTTLSPLQEQWQWLTVQQKQRWILIADSYDDFSPEEQMRIGEHMKEWAKFSLADQSQARLNYSNVTSLSAEDKRRLWEEYQALSTRERKRLAQGSVLRPGGVALAPRPTAKSAGRLVRVPAANINPNRANPPKILPPPEIRIQSRGVVTPVELGPLPSSSALPSTTAPVITPAPQVETAPVQTPSAVTPSPLPPLDNPAPNREPQSRLGDSPIHPPA